MSIRSVPLRRLATIAGVIAALVLGYGSIRAAAAWTAASAPLVVAPVSVVSLQDRLATEQARSQALTDQLNALASQSTDLATALATARARIVTDAATAKQLTKDLKAAKGRLARLEASIKAAQRAAARRAAAVPATTRVKATSGHGVGESDDEG